MLLEIEDLKTYIRQRSAVVRAVDGVSFTVDAGETVGIVGESGCGKTMTGMSIISLLPPGGYIAGGSIRFEGRELTKISDREIRDVRGNQVAVIFQDPMTSLNPTMTIGRQIAEPVVRHRDASRSAALKRAEEVLALVGMPKPKERLDDYPHQLSGGLRQRAMIAMALACEPRLLIADEPTTALDVTIQKQILELLDDLKSRLGMAMILITHDLGVIAGGPTRSWSCTQERSSSRPRRSICSKGRGIPTPRPCSHRSRRWVKLVINRSMPSQACRPIWRIRPKGVASRRAVHTRLSAAAKKSHRSSARYSSIPLRVSIPSAPRWGWAVLLEATPQAHPQVRVQLRRR